MIANILLAILICESFCKTFGQINRRVLFDEIISEALLRQIVSGVNPFELGW